MGLFGLGKKKDPDNMSVEELIKAADKFFDKGNKEMYFSYTVRAAERGHKASMERVALLYMDTRYGIPVPQEAVKWYLKLGEMGNYDAYDSAAKIYLKQNDKDNAIKCLELAGNNGIEYAAKELSDLYAGMQKDDLAFKWLQKAADMRDLDAMADMAFCYYDGIWTAKNKSLCYKWLETYAVYAEYYEEGTKLTEPQSPEKAYEYIERLDDEYKYREWDAQAVMTGEYLDILSKKLGSK